MVGGWKGKLLLVYSFGRHKHDFDNLFFITDPKNNLTWQYVGWMRTKWKFCV